MRQQLWVPSVYRGKGLDSDLQIYNSRQSAPGAEGAEDRCQVWAVHGAENRTLALGVGCLELSGVARLMFQSRHPAVWRWMFHGCCILSRYSFKFFCRVHTLGKTSFTNKQ